MRRLTACLAVLALAGCPATDDDDSAGIQPVTPVDEVTQDFFVDRTLTCGAGGWSTTADATATQYELYSCFSPSNFTDAVYNVGTADTLVWQSDGSTDGTFTAYTNPMYGVVAATTATTTEGSN